MRESLIERDDRSRIQEEGGWMLKFVSPGTVGVPDNIVLRPIPPEHQELVARYIRFAEYKASKKDVRPGSSQDRRRQDLINLGFAVDVINSKTN
jgi:MOSC domain-containing protein YiiM